MLEFLKTIFEVVEHPIIETLKMLPILFLAYLFMEWLEHADDGKMAKFVNKSRLFGPLFGSGLGLVPQCGFSGAIASMYAAGTVTFADESVTSKISKAASAGNAGSLAFCARVS